MVVREIAVFVELTVDNKCGEDGMEDAKVKIKHFTGKIECEPVL